MDELAIIREGHRLACHDSSAIRIWRILIHKEVIAAIEEILFAHGDRRDRLRILNWTGKIIGRRGSWNAGCRALGNRASQRERPNLRTFDDRDVLPSRDFVANGSSGRAGVARLELPHKLAALRV